MQEEEIFLAILQGTHPLADSLKTMQSHSSNNSSWAWTSVIEWWAFANIPFLAVTSPQCLIGVSIPAAFRNLCSTQTRALFPREKGRWGGGSYFWVSVFSHRWLSIKPSGTRSPWDLEFKFFIHLGLGDIFESQKSWGKSTESLVPSVWMRSYQRPISGSCVGYQ